MLYKDSGIRKSSSALFKEISKGEGLRTYLLLHPFPTLSGAIKADNWPSGLVPLYPATTIWALSVMWSLKLHIELGISISSYRTWVLSWSEGLSRTSICTSTPFLWKTSHKKLSHKNLKKYIFVHNDLRKTFYFRQFFILWSFVPTITKIAILFILYWQPSYVSRTVLGPTPLPAVVLCLAYWSNTTPTPLLSQGTQPPRPLPWRGGGVFTLTILSSFLANCSTCSRSTFPKTAVRGRVKEAFVAALSETPLRSNQWWLICHYCHFSSV